MSSVKLDWKDRKFIAFPKKHLKTLIKTVQKEGILPHVSPEKLEEFLIMMDVLHGRPFFVLDPLKGKAEHQAILKYWGVKAELEASERLQKQMTTHLDSQIAEPELSLEQKIQKIQTFDPDGRIYCPDCLKHKKFIAKLVHKSGCVECPAGCGYALCG